MKVSEWMSADPLSLPADAVVHEAVALLMKHRIRHLPVVDGGVLVGIVTDRDIKRALPSILAGVSPEQHQEFMQTTPIGRLMTRSPQSLPPDADIRKAVELMCQRKIGAIPVVENDRLLGILTETDLMRAFLHVLGKG